MRIADFARLLVLATIWGGSFLFQRMISPVFGPMATAASRVVIAGVALSLWLAFKHQSIDWRRHARALAVVGLFNSALPFAAFAYAALSLPAGYLAILNSTAPLFGAALAAIFGREILGARRAAGLACGIAGVALLVGLGPIGTAPRVLVAVALALAGALSYALASLYVKSLKEPIPTAAMATGSQWTAALVLLPATGFVPPRAWPDARIWLLDAALGIVCTAAAYLLYFRLIREIGPVRALTVTFLVPLFALLWGALVLDESLGIRTLGGAALVLLATWLVLSVAPVPARTRAVPPGAR